MTNEQLDQLSLTYAQVAVAEAAKHESVNGFEWFANTFKTGYMTAMRDNGLELDPTLEPAPPATAQPEQPIIDAEIVTDGEPANTEQVQTIVQEL